ncbi:PREDICTED: uncharacterized protein LOC106817714 [Priapulus caudatus]|uniref:Uncharacterized protein LOC106817714 n=1 Tax=Priapulus caudatus TaxID=37621 RepID=A0ABM1F0B8_PRICU|nr:PREDICTED: uncharacterized protein LOC106817714 [Priapulus caudatus]
MSDGDAAAEARARRYDNAEPRTRRYDDDDDLVARRETVAPPLPDITVRADDDTELVVVGRATLSAALQGSCEDAVRRVTAVIAQLEVVKEQLVTGEYKSRHGRPSSREATRRREQQEEQIRGQQEQIAQQQQKIHELQQALLAVNFGGKLAAAAAAAQHPGVMLVPVYESVPTMTATSSSVSLVHAPTTHMTHPLLAGAAGTTSLYPSPPGALPAQVSLVCERAQQVPAGGAAVRAFHLSELLVGREHGRASA